MSAAIETSGPPLPESERTRAPLSELFESAARARGDAPFLVSLSLPEESRSFAAFNEEAKAVARALVAAGLEPGQKVSVLSENRPRWCVAYAAVLHAGGIVVPIDAQLGPPAIHAVLADSAATGLFVSAELARHLPALRALGFDGRAFGLDEEGGQTPWSELAAGAEVELPPLEGGDRQAAILYTSGTTGSPKGVVLTHANLRSLADAVAIALEFRPSDRLIMFLPLQHVLSQVGSFLVPAAVRIPVVHAVISTGEDLLAAVKDGKVTILLAVPLLFHLIHARIERGAREAPLLAASLFRSFLRWNRVLRRGLGLNLGRLFFGRVHRLFGSQFRLLASGGSALSRSVQETFFDLGFDIIQAYGLTETSGGITMLPVGDGTAGVVGAPLPGASVRIDAPSADGIGEVLLQGPMITPGYHGRPEATAELLRDGWLHTGDLGRLDRRGYLQITGRSKDVIVLGTGKNIYPEDLEAHYSRAPLIAELCILGLESGEGEKLHAVVVPDWQALKRQGISAAREAVRFELEDLSAELPSYQRVLSFELQREPLPRTPTRKLQRFKVVPHRNSAGEGASSLPADEPEQAARLAREPGLTIARLIRGRLGEGVALQARSGFELDLGLDSLNRMELLLSIERELHVAFEDEEAAQLGTVDDLLQLSAAKLDEVREGGGAPRAGGWAELISQASPDDLPANLRKRRGFLSYCGLQSIVWSARLVNRILFRLRSRGLENLPDRGPFLLCPNHVSYIDGFLVACLLPRGVVRHAFVLGEADYVSDGIAGALARFSGIVPTNPNLHLRLSMRAGAAGLKDGRALMIFPEGTRSADGGLQELKQGAAILATELGLPIVPTLIEGAHEAWPRGASRPRFFTPCRVSFGEPLRPSEVARGLEGDAAHAAVTRRLREALVELGARA